MKVFLLIIITVLCTTNVLAENLASLGYSHGKITDGNTLRGADLKYSSNHGTWGWIASANYMKGSSNNVKGSYEGSSLYDGHLKSKYFSLTAGPSFKLSDRVTVYGTLGWARTKSELDSKYRSTDESGNYNFKTKTDALAYSVGMQFKVRKHLIIDAEYEGTTSNNALDDKHLNSFNIGLGYIF